MVLGRSEPDYGVFQSSNPVVNDIDSAELAVRLNSPVIHSRTGRVIFLDRFEDYQWDTIFGTAQLISRYTRTGSSCLRVIPAVDGAVMKGGIRRYITATRDDSNYGFETCFAFRDATNAQYIRTQVNISMMDLVVIRTYDVRWDMQAGKIQVYDGFNFLWVDVLNVAPLGVGVHSSPVWGTLKLTFQNSTRDYLSVGFNNQYATLTGIKGASGGAPGISEFVYLYLEGTNTGGSAVPFYFSSYSLTFNEP